MLLNHLFHFITFCFTNIFLYSRSQHYDNLQQAADSQLQQQKQPLKDATNTTSSKSQKNSANNSSNNNNEGEHQQPESTQQETGESNNRQQQQQQQQQQQGSRSLQCLETLAQKAGIHDITPEDCKYDIANTLLTLDRGHELVKQEFRVAETMAEIKNQQQQVGIDFFLMERFKKYMNL